MTAPPKPCPLCGCPFGGVSEEKPDRHDIDRAALVEVAIRGCHSFAYGTDAYPESEVERVAEGIVTEYLAEQERTDAAD